ncbi:TPA: hypothetical protein QDC20_000111 [Burkholderia aenigmatica]|uniref:hypothetical protein n=1 Tax=Burkholderia sp. AU45251 TaxID=3059204 RepID=UPI0026530ACF|nr:hypothetical protein [Burkholderia sp. AU45251]HDR9483019.1 hypothetical protein [Burkholderia aenigmatica]MDN7515883.1 hypothetical protein [Burkholderia sp. AU45251]HDR9513966.1 hypothetical protein [Burkholderia aenigmatica]HDR9591357.1 hypothetical protein [Burkholderia aenigmatica]HDR9598449.1 hypothetical protein [Burkholderia aenigmatica]
MDDAVRDRITCAAGRAADMLLIAVNAAPRERFELELEDRLDPRSADQTLRI